MAVHEVDGVLFSDADHVNNRTDVEQELRVGRGVTELCVRNNFLAPTPKEVIVHMWTRDGKTFSFYDRYVPQGQTYGTSLYGLGIQVVKFEIRWRVPGSGLPMWGTTGQIDAAPGDYFPAFGIRWDQNDLYSVIFPD